MILINRIRAKFITIKRDPPAVLMGCWRVLLFLVWCKFLFFEFPCCFCTLERLGYFFTQYLVTFFVRLSYLVTILPCTWLLLYILYMQYALLVRAKIRTKLCSSRLIRVIFRLTPLTDSQFTSKVVHSSNLSEYRFYELVWLGNLPQIMPLLFLG